uniref:cache domain-containing protein n=1 Tax=Candidatus Magnetaquicoccus inordinatus TaxID=2496818 RepID=UPI00187D4AB4
MNIRLRPKLIILFLLSALVTLLITGWMMSRWLAETSNEAARSRAATILEIKKNRMEQHIARYRSDMELLANGAQSLLVTQTTTPPQAERLESLRDLYAAAVQKQLQEWLQEVERQAASETIIKQLATIDWVFRDGGEKITSERWPVLAATMTPALNRLREKLGFDNLYLVSALGNVVLSAQNDPLLGKNISRGPLKDLGIGKLFADGLQHSMLLGFAIFPPLEQQAIGWLAAPIRKEGKAIGMLVARIAPTTLARVRPAVEESEKAIRFQLIGPDRLRYLESSGTTAPTATARKPEAITSPAALAALSGNKGAGNSKGSNGQPLLSAWTPLQMLPPPQGPDLSWAVLVEQPIAQTLSTDPKQGVPLYKQQLEQGGYYDLFLVQPDGEIVYSLAKQADFATNLLNGPYAQTNLGRLIQQVLAKPAFAMTDYEPYPPSNNEPAAFMAQPLLQEATIKAVVAVQLPMELLTNLMQHRDGLESDGDAYLVGPDFRLRSDSLRDPQNHSVVASFAGNLATNGAQNEAVQAALSGKTGLLLGKNWRGEPVYTAYAPLALGNGVNWAVITETPMLLGGMPMQRFPLSIWLAAVASLMVAMLLGWWSSELLSSGLLANLEALQWLRKGKQPVTPLPEGKDELGQLSREVRLLAERWQHTGQRLRESGKQIAHLGKDMAIMAQQAPRDPLLVDLESGEAIRQEIAARIQQHLKQIQNLQQIMTRITHHALQGKGTLEQAQQAAKEVAEKAAQFAE